MDLTSEEIGMLVAALLDHEQTLTTLVRYVPGSKAQLDNARAQCLALQVKLRKTESRPKAVPTPKAVE